MIEDIVTMSKKAPISAKEYLKLFPEKYIMTGTQNGHKIFISSKQGPKMFDVAITSDVKEAEKFSSLDTSDAKLGWYKIKTKIADLKFELHPRE